MSLPDVNVFPAPLSSTTRTEASALAWRNASTTAAYIAPVRAFFFSGRLNKTSSIDPACVTRTSLIGFSPMTDLRLSDQVVDLHREGGDQIGDLAFNKKEFRQPLDPRLVHIECSGDLDLQHVHIVAWPSVVPRYIAAGIGVVAADEIALAAQQRLRRAGNAWCAGGPVQIAQ